MTQLPLDGIRVLDLSKVLAGPLCAQYLGDMGADVIKVETLDQGDETRHWPPFRDVAGNRAGAVFLSANRNKRSLCLDLKTEAGRGAIYRLAKQSDIVIASFGPGVAEKLGVDALALRACNPQLIYCDISGFGSVGPMREGKGYDVILQAFCGMLSITGEPDGPAVRSPFSPVDQATGLHALIGILAALFRRERSGIGATVEASLFDTATGMLGYFLQSYWERGTEPQKPGSGHESLCPYQVFETADKPLILGVANDTLWRRFCALSKLDDIVDHPDYRTNADRVRNRKATVALVAEVVHQHGRDWWLVALDKAGIPNSPLHTLGELSAHPHTAASGMKFDYNHPVLGKLKGIAQPLRIDGERAQLRRPPPLHGEHSHEILLELGYDEKEIEALLQMNAPAETGEP
ncbi:MAG: coA-transferase family protein [Polaromonas sp.]|nr:coA-transferase family protein [Polaromonas sp.]